MPITIKEDDTKQGGFALIDLGRKIESPVLFSLRRLDVEPRNLGTSGWQPETVWLSADREDNTGPTTVLRVGPQVVDEISELVPVEIAVKDIGVIGVVSWPFIIQSSRHYASHPRISRGPTQSISATAKQRAPKAHAVAAVAAAQAPRIAPATPEPTEPERNSNEQDKPGWFRKLNLIAAAVGALYLVGVVIASLFAGSIVGPRLRLESAEVRLFQGTRGDRITPRTIQVPILSNTRQVKWRVANLPDWLTVNAREGIVESSSRFDLMLTATAQASNKPPGIYLSDISILAEGDEVVILSVKLVIDAAAPRLSTNASDPLVFYGQAGSTVEQRGLSLSLIAGETPVNWKLTAKPDWLSVDATSGTISGNSNAIVRLNLSPAASRLTRGEYRSELRFASVGGNEIVHSVKLLVSASEISIRGPTELIFEGPEEGNVAPSSAKIQILSGDKLVMWSLAFKPDWLTVDKTSGALYPNLQEIMTVSPTRLAASRRPAEYVSELRFTTNSGEQIAQKVRLVVRAIAPPKLSIPSIDVLVFRGEQHGKIEPQLLTLPITASERSLQWRLIGKPDWLALDKSSGSIGANSYTSLRVDVTPVASAMRPGEYSSEIRLEALDGNVVSQKVKLVIAPRVAPKLSTQGVDVLVFQGEQRGKIEPQSLMLPIMAGERSLQWKLIGKPDWLALDESSGSLPANSYTSLRVDVTPAASAMTPGEYSSEIRLEALDGNVVSRKVKLVIAPSRRAADLVPPSLRANVVEQSLAPRREADPVMPSLKVEGSPVLTFRVSQGESQSDAVTLALASNDRPVRWRLVSYPDWLGISDKSGLIEANSKKSLVLRPGGIKYYAAGEYSSELRFYVEGGNWTVVPVKLFVRAD